MQFERAQRKVVYVAADNAYRVTPAGVFDKVRAPIDSSRHLVGISTAVAFWDNADRRNHSLGCTRTVRDAWTAGDRYMLDTDEARKAAEVAADLAETMPDEEDIKSALVDLENAIARVDMSNQEMQDFEVYDVCAEAIDRCSSVEGFWNWNAHARRRKFLYLLPKKKVTDVTCTLMDLYFGYGATPLLTSRQRQELLQLDRGDGPEGAKRYFDECLRKITAYRFM